MNAHIFLDNLTISLSALFLSKSKFFNDNIESPTFREHLQQIHLELPDVRREGMFELKAETAAGVLNPAVKIAQWLGDNFPFIIFHHGSGENPFDGSFKKIFPLKKREFRANLIVIRAPYNKSRQEYISGVADLSNFTAMLSVSIVLIEQLIKQYRAGSNAEIIITGISLGGWVANLHHTYFNSADIYKPLMAGAGLAEVFLNSSYKKLTSSLALKNPEKIRRILNFEEDFSAVDNGNVFPLLGLYDQFIRYERQKHCYAANRITVMKKGHITGAMAFNVLRHHIIGDMW